jgi:hypothetical protein
MYGDAVPVRGGDAGRGGIGVSDTLKLQLADIAIDRVGLAAAGLAGEAARAGSIEISSMIRTLVFSMRAARRRLVDSTSRSRRVRASRTPMPLQA